MEQGLYWYRNSASQDPTCKWPPNCKSSLPRCSLVQNGIWWSYNLVGPLSEPEQESKLRSQTYLGQRVCCSDPVACTHRSLLSEMEKKSKSITIGGLIKSDICKTIARYCSGNFYARQRYIGSTSIHRQLAGTKHKAGWKLRRWAWRGPCCTASW